MGEFSEGRVKVATGDMDRGIAEVERGLEAYRATGQRVAVPGMFAFLSEAHYACGNGRRAAAAAISGKALMGETGETRHESHLHRVEGEAHTLCHARELARQSFEAAIRIAETRGERFRELTARESRPPSRRPGR